MVYCSSCGRAMERVPDWMRSVTVEYACTNCPKRQMKNIAFINFEPAIPPTAKVEVEAEETPDTEEEATEV